MIFTAPPLANHQVIMNHHSPWLLLANPRIKPHASSYYEIGAATGVGYLLHGGPPAALSWVLNPYNYVLVLTLVK